MVKASKISISAIASAALLAGCATTTNTPPGAVKVDYSSAFITGAKLKEVPTEVQIVKREDTGNAVAAQVGLIVLMLALVGGVAASDGSVESHKHRYVVQIRTNLGADLDTCHTSCKRCQVLLTVNKGAVVPWSMHTSVENKADEKLGVAGIFGGVRMTEDVELSSSRTSVFPCCSSMFGRPSSK